MARLRFTYRSETRFSVPVTGHSFLLRVLPLSDGPQQLEQASLSLEPGPDSLCSDVDKWGAEISYGIASGPHDHFSYVSSGIVETSGEPRLDPHPSPVFRVPTALTGFCEEMRGLCVEGGGLEAAKAMMVKVSGAVAYVPGSTGVATSAAEAFRQRKGVCQDFSHILIALCRECGIPARYVCGFVTGEGETHAWTEVWHEGSWYGLDATSGLPCDDTYIAVAFGRDAADCSVSRGVFTGSALQRTETKVTVEVLFEK